MSKDECIKEIKFLLQCKSMADINFYCSFEDIQAPLKTILDLYNKQKQQLAELQAIEEEHRKENGELRKKLQSSVENSAELQRICRETNMDDSEAILYLTHTSIDDFNLEKHQSENRIEAIKTIISLYKQEKEKNKVLSKKLYICTPEVPHTQHNHYISYVDLVNELYQEKEKNKELERYKKYYESEKIVWYKGDYVSKDKIRSKLEYATKMVKFYTTNEPDHILIPIYNEVINVCKEFLGEE